MNGNQRDRGASQYELAPGSASGSAAGMGASTILWHDYETSGRSSRSDRPLQFASIRTTEDLQEVGQPLAVRARLGPDVLPDPEACLVTRVVPGDHADQEVSELEFAGLIAEVMDVPGTCVTGYNSIRFDDEFTRFMMWRCLLPIYDREYRNGNSRWDLIDPLRTAYALRPDGIRWPHRDDGSPSFKLADLATTNGIGAESAHDALADVQITLAMARLLRDAQPKLFDHLYRERTKAGTAGRLAKAIDARETLVHISGRFGADVACTSVVAPLTRLPELANQIVTIDLRHDPEVLLDHDPDSLRELMYTRRSELPPDAPRVGVKTIHANKAPVIAPMPVLDAASWARIQLDPAQIERRHQWVNDHRQQLEQLAIFLCERESTGDPDPDTSLYSGLLDRQDQQACRKVHRTPATGWQQLESQFTDERLPELLFRLRCRQAPETLDEADRKRWLDHLQARFTTPLDAPLSRLDAVRHELTRLRTEQADSLESLAILDRVAELVDRQVHAAGL